MWILEVTIVDSIASRLTEHAGELGLTTGDIGVEAAGKSLEEIATPISVDANTSENTVAKSAPATLGAMANHPTVKGKYGIDAPWVPWLWYGLGILFLVFGIINLFNDVDVWYILSVIYFLGGGLVWLIGGTLYLNATFRGKFAVWAEVLDAAALQGNEKALDIGCGRGAVTVPLAQRLPDGHVTGIDLWRSIDQSGNNTAATEANLALNGVTDRVTLATADMTALPFDDNTFDVATASLSIHNVPSRAGRASAITEAIRVLKPGGKLLIVDISKVTEYKKELAALGISPTSDAPAGWRMWWSGPWMSTRILTASR